jgi:hypothetical protein
MDVTFLKAPSWLQKGGRHEPKQRVETGGWLYVPRGTPFRWWNAHNGPTRWQLTYAPGGFEQYFVELAAAIAEHAPKTPQALAELARPLWAKYGVVISMSNA